MSISLLRQLLMKEAVKKSAGSSGIMTINKNITKEVDQLLQKYINDALAQGVDLDTLGPEQLKMIVAMNSKATNRVISGSSPEGRAITEKLLGKKGRDVNIYSKQYIDNLDKEIIDSGLYTKKEWTNLSDELKEARRRKFDLNYDDAMEGTVESNVVDMTGKNIDTSQGIMGGKSVKELMESGQVQKGTDDIKISEKITDRDMFKNSNLNKKETIMDRINTASNRIKEIQKEQAEMYRPKTDAEIKAKFDKQNQESIQRFKDKMKKDEPEDKADGGRIGFRAGKFVLDKIVAKLLGNPKKVKQAVDDIFPTGDYKYDAQMAADALVENNPRIFKNKLYEDLDLDTQMEIYGAVLEPIQKNMSMAIKMKKASRPEKTLAAMKEGKGIDMSDPAIADEFARFMKETDPQGSKTIEQTVELANFDPKKVKGNAEGGRIGYYTGGMVDVEPNLSDIGHGSDALMARTRLVSPDGQATTSTGLNYLLAEDNDNIRVPFSAGGGGRRAFLKLLATLGGGIAGIKTGILGLGGKKTGKQVAKEVVKSAGASGNPPPYFFKLVEKIKTLGDDTLATQDKAIAKKYKDYVMEEDFAGNIEIIKKGDDIAGNKIEDVYMRYTVDEVPLRGKKGSSKVEEYEEYTARPDGEGKMKDVEPGVPDEVVMEVEAGSGNVPESFYTGPDKIKKADGGRIGFSPGGLANVLARLGIKGSSGRFLEKVFGKEGFKEMTKNDPDMYRGLLEVVEMFRSRDKEGLKSYMKNFLPHMDDAEIEQFIVGSTPDIEGLSGQLTRLGSGRDYSQKLQMMKNADEVKKLEKFDIKNVTKNAEGGRIGLFLGGGLTAGKGLLKNMLKFMAKDGSHKKSPAEVLKMLNPKQFQKLLNDPRYMGKVSSEAPEGLDKIIQDMIGKTKTERSDMVGDIISTSRNIKKVDDDILKYKLKIIEDMVSKGIDREIAVEAAENISKEVAKSAGKKSTPKITEQGLLELENLQKNLLTKDRKLQAQGGLTTMLGE